MTFYFVLLLFLGKTGIAQQKNPFIENRLPETITKNISLRYLVHLPNQSGGMHHPLPLLLYLHGGMGRGNDFKKLYWYPVPKMILENTFPDSFVVVIPQCPEGKNWIEYTDALSELIHQTIKYYSIDTSRIYGIGYSMGGNGIAYLAYMHPELFSAIAAMSGFYYTTWASRLKDIPSWFFHGAKDTILNIDESDKIVEELRKFQANVKYTREPEGIHSPPAVEQHLEVLQWFLEHSK